MNEMDFDDREFGEEYKRMFDGIRASDDLRRRIAELPNTAKRRRTHDLRPYIAAAGAAAAGLTIFAAVHNYEPGTGDDGIISETVATSTERPGRSDRSAALPPMITPETADTPQTTSAPEAADAVQTPAAAAPRQESGSAGTVKTTEEYMKEALEKYGGEQASGGSAGSGAGSAAPAQNNAASASVPAVSSGQDVYFEAEIGVPETKIADEPAAESEPFAAASSADAQNKVSDGAAAENSADVPVLRAANGKRVVLNMNSPSVYAAYEAQYYDTYADTAESAGYVYENWDNERYFEYIGSDVIEAAALPEDFSYTGDTETGFMVDPDGVPMNDSRIFVFEGDGGRFVSIMTSKDTLYADTYLADESLAKSDIGGVDAVVFDMSGEYKCYMVYDGVSYIIDAEGTDEEELSELLLSLVS